MKWCWLWWEMTTDAIRLQRWRRGTQVGFFLLFLVAPGLNWLRFDLNEAQLWFLGYRWTLGIEAFVHGQATASETAWHILVWGFLPALLLVSGFLGVAYRFGRVYCGWLCPHFSAVEMLNGLLHRAIGRFSVWDRSVTPHPGRTPQARWWGPFIALSGLLGFVWAVTLLTYLLPPEEIWSGVWHASLTPNQARFIGIGTLIFTLEFLFARHLFCRFGCAAGLFQSLAWMANDRAMVVSFSRERARECQTCDAPRGSACDNACPMRLHPRNIKRMMFSCVQCARCLSACEASQVQQERSPNLNWTIGLDAVRETLRQRREEAR
jgi:polyferredoxin